MSALPLRKLLMLIAAAPLSAFLWVSGMSVFESYRQYTQLKDQLIMQRLANTGGRVAQAMPAESLATPETRAARRKDVDNAIADLKSTFAEWKAAGHSDAAIEKAHATIVEREKLLAPFRARVDAGTSDRNDNLFVLQPFSAAGLDLVRRSAGTIHDLELSRLIDGYHALMQVHDAGLIESTLGRAYFSGRPLSAKETSFVHLARGLRARYLPQFTEFLSADLVSAYNRFNETEDGKMLATARQNMYDAKAQGEDKALSDLWMKGSFAQITVTGDLVAKAGVALATEAIRRQADLRQQLLQGCLIAAGVAVGMLLLCFLVVRSVSRMIQSIEGRMRLLAEGDKATAIPFSERTDEIGDIARSVEVFRKAAIRNGELEAQAEETRRQAERERIETQRLAESAAEERLNRATGSLAAALKRLAAGDMQCEIEEKFAPQFEPLRLDFNNSIGQLRQVLISVGHSATAVSGGSGEISHASKDLAMRTSQQASSLEQTAAALATITSNVRSTSAGTVEARNLVRDARSQAESSIVIVGTAVTAMGRIEHASREINQIITVIDEIAFQTNLLALNAGVEAARAGEAGRGFAVVAQEVRELAQRSANAAREIKSLIGNSEIAVNEGVKLVNDTGNGLSTIAGLVQQINAHMDAIAAAAQEQSSGLGEVNKAVNQMDLATQQNAAMVEEMNAAATSLAQESNDLSSLLRQFQTESRGYSSASALAA